MEEQRGEPGLVTQLLQLGDHGRGRAVQQRGEPSAMVVMFALSESFPVIGVCALPN
jgi:hypothetical protein